MNCPLTYLIFTKVLTTFLGTQGTQVRGYLGDHLLKDFSPFQLSSKVQSAILPDSLMEAQFVLPKPGNDPLECSSYRTIAVLNQDLKILTKVLATTLLWVITTLVAIDQTGFIPQKATDTNLCRLFAHLQIDHAYPVVRVVVSLDMAKAFKSVDWTYVHGLKTYGFP